LVTRHAKGWTGAIAQRTGCEQVVYVNEAGAIVQAPATVTTTTRTTTTTQTAQPVAVDTQETVLSSEDLQKGESRYQLLEKKGKKEIYLDRQTGQKVTVKREKD
jgi:hypothetical protein